MKLTESGVRHAARARVAGGLLTAVGVIFICYLIFASIIAAASTNPWTKAFMPFVIIVGLAVSLPPLLVGIGILNHGVLARRIGIAMGFVGALGFGAWLVIVVVQANSAESLRGVWLGISVLVVLLATSLVTLWALVTAGDFFGSRYDQLAAGRRLPKA